jgi:hypothetical protein
MASAREISGSTGKISGVSRDAARVETCWVFSSGCRRPFELGMSIIIHERSSQRAVLACGFWRTLEKLDGLSMLAKI